MEVRGKQKKGSGVYGNQQSPVINSQPKTSNKSRGICRGLHDCMSMGSVVSTSQQQQHHHQSSSRLETQVTELEKEVQKQKELRMLYRKRMERTQDYLRHCLQIAQDNGFLHIIIGNKLDHFQSPPLDSDFLDAHTSPQLIPTPIHPHLDLTSLLVQSKLNGWFIDPDEIELQERTAQGSTANIYKATWRGLAVAVKCMYPHIFLQNEKGFTFFAQELETMSKQRHPYVLQLMGACLEPPNYAWIVSEYLSMTLKEWLHGHGNRQKMRVVTLPPLEERIAKALEISQAMQYLHEQIPKVIHRDLKPSNIFMDDAMHVRVADFGNARFLSDTEMALTGETGTYVYMAPEVIRCEPYNEKSDVYSFSIILNELITGEHPYIETDYGPAKIAMEVGEGKLRPKLPKNEGQLGELIDLICLSWNENATVRPSFATITCTLRKFQNRQLV